jgi:hypothetical protein
MSAALRGGARAGGLRRAALLDRPRDIVFIDMVRDGAGPRRTRARTLAGAGASDRGEHAVSRREIERVLETATPVEGAARCHPSWARIEPAKATFDEA